MKRRRMRCIAAAVLACGLLAACALPGGGAAPESEAASESEPPSAPKGVCVPIGEAVTADLDGNGAAETIYYQIQPENEEQPVASLTVDGVEYAAALADMGAWFVAPDTENYYITDLDESDGVKEIALMDRGPSDDPVTYFFRYADKELRCIGSVSDLIENDTFRLDGAGTVQACGRLSVLQTWQAKFTWSLQDGALQPAAQSSYQPFYYGGSAPVVTVNELLKVYESPDTSAPSADWLPGDEAVTFPSTDNRAWVEISRGKQHGWIHLCDFSVLDNDGITDAAQVFSGLVYAD